VRRAWGDAVEVWGARGGRTQSARSLRLAQRAELHPPPSPPPATPGRALESRAKVQAASDLKALAHLIPATARLQLDPGAAPGAGAAAAGSGGAPAVEYIQVSTRSVRQGDIVRVLPGEAAGGVRAAGRGL
jgi:hypothetical protein